MALEIMLITEYAKITITVPPIAANRAPFAVLSFPGSPWAVKNATPVITQKITTITVATIQITLATFATKPVIVIFAPEAPPCADTKETLKSKAKIKNRNKFFFNFINLLFSIKLILKYFG